MKFLTEKRLLQLHCTCDVISWHATSKKKTLFRIFSFQYGAISIRKKKTFSIIFGKNQNKIVQKLSICNEIWHFWK